MAQPPGTFRITNTKTRTIQRANAAKRRMSQDSGPAMDLIAAAMRRVRLRPEAIKSHIKMVEEYLRSYEDNKKGKIKEDDQDKSKLKKARQVAESVRKLCEQIAKDREARQEIQKEFATIVRPAIRARVPDRPGTADAAAAALGSVVAVLWFIEKLKLKKFSPKA